MSIATREAAESYPFKDSFTEHGNERTNLRIADLTNANLRGADLEGANLKNTETVEQRVGHIQVVRIHNYQRMLDMLVIRAEGDGGEYSDDLVILQGATWVMDDYEVRLKESPIMKGVWEGFVRKKSDPEFMMVTTKSLKG